MIVIDSFSVRADVDDADVLAADAAVQQGFAYQQVGIVRRTTARDEAGGWVVITQWADAAAADAAAAAADASDHVARLRSLIDPASHVVQRCRPLA